MPRNRRHNSSLFALGRGSENLLLIRRHTNVSGSLSLRTRCGCLAQMRVQCRWIISYFDNVHNHEMLDRTLTFMLPSHRKMNATAIDQMNMMLKVGIKTPQIYSSFVHTAGEENLGTFVYYLADKEGRLVHLFWSNNCSQLDYHVFGDVVAFDATYRKNKYMCPLIVFFGINHHNQTIVFAAALVANESEETYSGLLERFLEAMKEKAPECVITDGHRAMRKAIEKIFPMAYHRLCAWHLLLNATLILANPAFTFEFKKCMLFYYEVSEFEARWERLVTELQFQDNQWVCDLYDRRKMWAMAHIRGHFFDGFWTTSRCKGLHSMLGKFVHSRHNLRDFVEQYFRCVSEMRSRETQSDMHSVVGHLVFQGPLHDLKRMESLGIPCYHIVALFVYLDFMEIPTSLVLGRWSKNAWSKVRQYVKKGPFCWDSMSNRRQGQQKQPSHEEGVDEDNYYTPNFGEEVDDEYPHYHSEP
ncbi:protein FAR1-RELATED SEQUENCE 5-like [Arachis duranensis]|uniref:Protein FAR1-RELATED SEQUENCE 5-like n=1 Tax=Arachis duranensis TaxID=130453 RepID=A0A6P5N124_ARADU|nr:protein FAR1-RELATED SEQUENCE 5-like [Arachis duranensis]